MITLDILPKYLFTVTSLTLTGKDMIQALKSIFKQGRNIIIITRNEVKSPLRERSIMTVKSRPDKYMLRNKTVK